MQGNRRHLLCAFDIVNQCAIQHITKYLSENIYIYIN